MKKYYEQNSYSFKTGEFKKAFGKLTQSYLSFNGFGRDRGKNQEELKEDLSNKIADVFAQVLLFAKNNDIEKALNKKRFKYLKN